MEMSRGVVTDFNGVFVQQQYKPGQKYIQLIFRTSDGMRLSLTRNAKMVRSLDIGQTYRVTGAEQQSGDRRYVYEPAVTVFTRPVSLLRRNWRLTAVAAVTLVLTGTTGTVLAMRQDTPVRQSQVSAASVDRTPAAQADNTQKPVSAAASDNTPASATAGTPRSRGFTPSRDTPASGQSGSRSAQDIASGNVVPSAGPANGQAGAAGNAGAGGNDQASGAGGPRDTNVAGSAGGGSGGTASGSADGTDANGNVGTVTGPASGTPASTAPTAPTTPSDSLPVVEAKPLDS